MNAISILPLSLSQMGAELYPKANENASIRFHGNLSVPALSRALAFIMRRHEGLRMRVVHPNERPQQLLIGSVDSYDIPILAADNLAAAEDRITACLWTPTDLENDGPLRAELLRIGEDEHVLLLVIHVIAMDAYAAGLFVRELLIAYDFYTRDQWPSSPPAMQYSDYVLNEERCGEELSDAQLKYWRSVLGGSRHPIPKQEGCSARSAGQSRVLTSSITTIETQRLQDFASAANVSMATALYAIIFLSISEQYSTDDVFATVIHSGRDSRPLQTLGARTARAFWLRMIVNHGTTLAELSRNIQAAFMQGALASRAPFTYQRALAQALDQPQPPVDDVDAKATADQRIQLCIVDSMATQREGFSIPHLYAERILLGPHRYGGHEREAAPPAGDSLAIWLRRDLAAEAGRPVSFVGIFYTDAIAEKEVRRLLNRMCVIAQTTRRENQNLAIGELSRITSPRLPQDDP